MSEELVESIVSAFVVNPVYDATHDPIMPFERLEEKINVHINSLYRSVFGQDLSDESIKIIRTYMASAVSSILDVKYIPLISGNLIKAILPSMPIESCNIIALDFNKSYIRHNGYKLSKTRGKIFDVMREFRIPVYPASMLDSVASEINTLTNECYTIVQTLIARYERPVAHPEYCDFTNIYCMRMAYNITSNMHTIKRLLNNDVTDNRNGIIRTLLVADLDLYDDMWHADVNLDDNMVHRFMLGSELRTSFGIEDQRHTVPRAPVLYAEPYNDSLDGSSDISPQELTDARDRLNREIANMMGLLAPMPGATPITRATPMPSIIPNTYQPLTHARVLNRVSVYRTDQPTEWTIEPPDNDTSDVDMAL